MDYPSLPIDSIVSGYKGAFDWLARATSRNVTVHVEPLQSGCPNCKGMDFISHTPLNIYEPTNPFSASGITVIPSLNISGIMNRVFVSGENCPICNGTATLFSPASGTVSARIEWSSQDNVQEIRGVKVGVLDRADVRLKVTGAADLDLLDRAKLVNVDGTMCKIVKGHIPVGLRDIHTWYYYLDRQS